MEDLERQLSSLPEGYHCPNDLIRQYKDKIIQLKITDPEKVPIFFEKYPTVFNMIVKGGDLSFLDLFLERIEHVQSGKEDLKEVEKQLAGVLNDKYVVPKLAEAKNE